jgi:hypothetical protein
MRRTFRILLGLGLAVLGGCAEQNALPADIASMLKQPPDPLNSRTYSGQYRCLQGTTGVSLQILGRRGDKTVAVFHFYPLPTNLDVSSGSFIVEGAYDPVNGSINLHPLSWITRPSGFIMTGLSGTSTDRGRSFDGSVTDSFLSCSTFSITEVR